MKAAAILVGPVIKVVTLQGTLNEISAWLKLDKKT